MLEPDPSDPSFWDGRWSEVLASHAERIAQMPPSTYVTDLAVALAPGRALDAGCGHGADAMWLAGHGWQVTAVDFSAAVLEHDRATAATLGPELAARIDWVQGDLSVWGPEPAAYELVTSLYVHSGGPVEELVARLARGTAPGGTLLLVGHLPVDLETGEPTPAAGQTQVTVEAATAVLREGWDLVVAEHRPRTQAGTGHDAVVQARRLA